ncbi:MAG: DNA-processing protein DprA [Azoarcus sp.]|nr:DNA-processing protein DprA [Azoarcus sp.]
MLTPGLGPATQRKLLAAFGLPQGVFAQSHGSIARTVGADATRALLAGPRPGAVEEALAWAAEPGNHLLTLADEVYPPILFEIADPPLVLYVKGDPARLARPALAMVGARAASPQGEANASAFARALSEGGFTIVSGLAQGIDAAAHRGALEAEGGCTVAVIGTGADRIYPAGNAALARAIAAQGVIVSEFPLGTPPKRENFPRRNRLIAGLAQGVLVVEAAIGSGSLITARLALEAGREVFAIPGSIHAPLARGCHRLIREGAKLVETAEDVFEELRGRLGQTLPVRPPRGLGRAATLRAAPVSSSASPPQAPFSPKATPAFEAALSPEAARVLEALGDEARDIDTLALASALSVDVLQTTLLALELEGGIVRLPGGRFQRLHGQYR